MQDLEFTIERGKLWMLQTRTGKRTAKAALKIAVDMAGEGLISSEEAVARIDPASLDQLLHPTLDPKAERQVIGTGPAGLAGRGDRRDRLRRRRGRRAQGPGRKAILVRVETSPEDIHGMHAAAGHPDHPRRHDQPRGRGGARHGQALRLGRRRRCASTTKTGTLIALGVTLKKGDVITIDGATGQVLKGAVPMLQPELSGDFAALMGWADALRRMKVRDQCRDPGRRPHGALVRRRGHRPVPHRAHVLRRATASSPCAR